VGYGLAGLLFVLEIVAGIADAFSEAVGFWIALDIVTAVLGWFYWLYCVYKYHDIMFQVPGWDHPIGVGRAVGFHFIPLYNFYWVFKWPKEIANFANWRAQAKIMSPIAAGSLMVAATLVGRFFDAAIGLALIFSAGAYISARLRRAFAAPPPPPSPKIPSFQLGL